MKVQTEDGWSLDLRRIPAQGTRRGAVLLGHAMMVDRRSVDRPEGAGLASHLASRGWEVFLPDLRGRGDSGPTPEAGGDWSYHDLVAFDLPALTAAVRAACPGLPLVLVGNSLTGHVALASAGQGLMTSPPDAWVLFGVNIWLPSLDPWLPRRIARTLIIWAFEVFTRLHGYFPARRARMGPCSESKSYVADQVRFFQDDFWGTPDGTCDYLAGLPRVQGPVLSVLSRGDRLLGHPVCARRWIAHLGEERAQVWVVGRGTHGLSVDPSHVGLVADPRSRPLWAEVATWMEAAVGR